MARRGFRLLAVLPAAALIFAGCAHDAGQRDAATQPSPTAATAAVGSVAPSPTHQPASAGPVSASTVAAMPTTTAPSTAVPPSTSPQVLTVQVTPAATPTSGPLPAPPSNGVAGVGPAVPSGGVPVELVSAKVVVPETPTPAAQVAAAPIGAPQILHATLSPDDVSTGTKVAATVRTTPEVVSVVAKIAGQTIPVPKVGVGRFAGTTTVPLIPPFFHGTYAVTFVAVNARGVSTQAAVNVKVH